MTTDKKDELSWSWLAVFALVAYGAYRLAVWLWVLAVQAFAWSADLITSVAIMVAGSLAAALVAAVLFDVGVVLARWIGGKLEDHRAPARSPIPSPAEFLGTRQPHTPIARLFTRLVREDYRRQQGGAPPMTLSEQQCRDYRASALKRQLSHPAVRAEYEAEVLGRSFARAQESAELRRWVEYVAAGTVRRRAFFLTGALVARVPFLRVSFGSGLTGVTADQLLGSPRLFNRVMYSASFALLPMIQRQLAGEEGAEDADEPGYEASEADAKGVAADVHAELAGEEAEDPPGGVDAHREARESEQAGFGHVI